MSSSEIKPKVSDLLQAWKDFKDQFFMLENLATGERKIYKNLQGPLSYRKLCDDIGEENCRLTRLDQNVGKILFDKSEDETLPDKKLSE